MSSRSVPGFLGKPGELMTSFPVMENMNIMGGKSKFLKQILGNTVVENHFFSLLLASLRVTVVLSRSEPDRFSSSRRLQVTLPASHLGAAS